MPDTADVGRATGVGSLPGTDPTEAAKLVAGELPLLPHIAELPARGPGADMIGRTAALLVDLPVQLVPTGWRLASHAGRDLRRAQDFLAWDVDALEQSAAAHTGPLKLQVAGPWTLAANLELATGHRVVSDYGATRDLAESLAEGLRAHLADVARRLPSAELVVQFDEPSLPAVLTGTLPTASGWGTIRAVERAVVRDALRDLLEVAPGGGRVVHCCARDLPFALLREAGIDAISFDALIERGNDFTDGLGEAVDAGIELWLGVLPAIDSSVSFEHARKRVETMWNELGFPRSRLAGSVVVTPSCGLAGATPSYARRVMRIAREVGTWLVEASDE